MQRGLERRRQAFPELLERRRIPGVGLLTPAASRLRAKPVDGDAAGDPAKPGARRAASRVEAPPAAKGLLERLGGEILRGGAVPGQIDEIAVHGVQLLLHDLGEGGTPRDQARSVERGRGRVHAL